MYYVFDIDTYTLHHRRSRGVGTRASPPTEMPPMTKMWQKSLLFLQFQVFLASLRTTVHAYHSNQQ